METPHLMAYTVAVKVVYSSHSRIRVVPTHFFAALHRSIFEIGDAVSHHLVN